MAKKISQLPPFVGTVLDGTSEVPVNSGGVTYRAQLTTLPLSSPVRKTVTINSVGASQQTGTVLLSQVVILLKMASTGQGRLRLYTTAATRDADLTRPIGGAISQSTGLLFEGVTSSAVLAFDATPVPTLVNGEPTTTKYIAYTIDPAQGTNYTITLTYLEIQS